MRASDERRRLPESGVEQHDVLVHECIKRDNGQHGQKIFYVFWGRWVERVVDTLCAGYLVEPGKPDRMCCKLALLGSRWGVVFHVAVSDGSGLVYYLLCAFSRFPCQCLRGSPAAHPEDSIGVLGQMQERLCSGLILTPD